MIDLENETVKNYVGFKLGKIDTNFTASELATIDELFIDAEEELFDLRKLSLFTGLKKIELLNFVVSNEDIEILKGLKDLTNITFDRCEFEDENKIKELNLEYLSLIRCNLLINDFVFSMTNLKGLTLVGTKLNIVDLNKLNNLTYLRLSFSVINDKENININSLKELYIDYTNILDLSFVNNLTNLELLSISESQFYDNKELVKEFTNRGIEVLNESMTEFGDDYYEE